MEKELCQIHESMILNILCLNKQCNDKGININLCRYCCMDEHDKHEILDIEALLEKNMKS